ncbi:cytochrome c [Novosphingobium sp. 1949]|uniref:Cytochrome c n=1 Tax=Novosphingobium organovorum TaxID=2930092 RepID=A0ABT0BD66_9SPHN|nr:cytochrome c [Novosphingobium organovorum]MCJ2182996.1 cytochrome c [Novosphingobium organovorum]
MASKSLAGLALPALALAFSLSACNGSSPSADASAGATGAAASAASDAGDTIEAREDNFKAIAKTMKATKGELDGSSPDFSAIAANATTIAEKGQKILPLFPAGTGPESGEKTEALPAIWERPDDFKAATAKLIEAAGKMRTAAEAKDLAGTKAGFGEVGMACKGCHEDFRKEEKH